jgi:multidrug resistance efflux pump
MEKDKLPPIPTPASQRWREFRIQVLPFAVFLGVLVGIVFLWKSYVQPIGVIGYADTNLVNVTSLQDGVISELFVERFQNVTTNQVIAIVVNTDPALIQAQIESAQADIKVLDARNRVDVQRTKQAMHEFVQDLFSRRVEQVQDMANLILASNEFRRVENLFKSGNMSEADLDATRARRDAMTAAIEERARQIIDLEKSIEALRKEDATGESSAFAEAVDKKARELELMLKPSTLKSPINGMVSMVHHIPGERILRGMPVVSISNPDTKHIIAYVRQPVVRIPTTNDFAQIITRSQPRQTAFGRILRVGAQMEPIDPGLLAADAKRVEVGLPILVEVPPGIRLLPGEHLNLGIEYAGSPGAPK